jgi:hypothetical protein
MKALKISDEHAVSNIQVHGLKDFQKAVNGYIEFIQMPFFDMIINEEHNEKCDNINCMASIICVSMLNHQTVIKGNVVLVGPTDENGRTTEFTDEMRTRLFDSFPVLKGRYIA